MKNLHAHREAKIGVPKAKAKAKAKVSTRGKTSASAKAKDKTSATNFSAHKIRYNILSLRQSVGLVVLLFGLLIVACEGLLVDSVYSAPYQISESAINLGSGECYDRLGITLDLNNTSEKAIVGIIVYFRLYTKDGNAKYKGFPTYISNEVERGIYIGIEGNSTSSLCISIDDKLTYTPTDTIIAKPFIVRSITYNDGEVWQDEHEVYKTEIQ